MRQFLLSTAAAAGLLLCGVPVNAADFPAYKAPPPPVPVWSWTGFYAGVHLGAGWGYKDWSDPFPPVLAFGNFNRLGGAVAGGQIGFNFQVGVWVWGLEADAAWARLEGSHTCFTGIGGVNCSSRVNSLGTYTGRLGYAVGRTLLYAKGGGAWVHDRYEMNLTLFGLGIPTTSSSRGGWTIGGGIEHALAPNWSMKLEYNYLDFGNRTETFAAPPPLDRLVIDQRLNVVKLGVNYLFGYRL